MGWATFLSRGRMMVKGCQGQAAKAGNPAQDGLMQSQEFASPITMIWKPTKKENPSIATTVINVSVCENIQNSPYGYLSQKAATRWRHNKTGTKSPTQTRCCLAPHLLNSLSSQVRNLIFYTIDKLGPPLIVLWLLCYDNF